MFVESGKDFEMSDSDLNVIKFPQVDRVLREPVLTELSGSFRRDVLADLVREELGELRAKFERSSSDAADAADAAGAAPAARVAGAVAGAAGVAKSKNGKKSSAADVDPALLEPASVAGRVADAARSLLRGGVRRVINGTGVILNTNLGRAPLPVSTLDKLTELGQGYTSLEIDVETGKRGERTAMVSRLLSLLTGSESAIVVNNNASAVMLAVSALARGREVIVSRGELIEIGGSFRLPDVITAAGGTLKEVGTTNRTRSADFANAISDKTGMMMRCHRSNFEITGFTEEAKLHELVQISESRKIPLVEDLGSGALFDISKLGLAYEPTVDKVIESGVSVVLFSGDKLLGGPQAGIVAGKREYVSAMRKDPMYRALRADKLIIALIEIVLTQYLSPDPTESLPVINLASQSPDAIQKRLRLFLSDIETEAKAGGFNLSIVASHSTLGGGSLPGKTLPSFALQIESQSQSSAKISASLRGFETPVITTIQDERVQIDFRTILPRDEGDLLRAVRSLWTPS